MNLKKLAEQKIDELSGKITPEQIMENAENDSVQLVLEGLEDELSLVENTEEKEEELSIELISEDSSLEDSQKPYRPRIKKDLFAGYLGELNEAPNPLEYGANATYRNLREGIVYKKGPDNLWEVFVKDGAPGRQGPAAPGGGCGVTEVKNIVENRITSQPIVANYPGSTFNPYQYEALPTSAPYVGHEVAVANSLSPLGFTWFYWAGSAYKISPEQVLVDFANSDGSPILDTTAESLGMTVGVNAFVWRSSVLPTWMLAPGLRLAATFEFGFRDPSSVASCTMRATIGDIIIQGTDPNNCLVGITASAAPSYKGFVSAPLNFRRFGVGGYSVAGGAPFSNGQNMPRDMFQTFNNPIMRVDFIPGALTNVITGWSATLKIGPC